VKSPCAVIHTHALDASGMQSWGTGESSLAALFRLARAALGSHAPLPLAGSPSAAGGKGRAFSRPVRTLSSCASVEYVVMTMSCSARKAGRVSRCWPWYVYACARARRVAVSGVHRLLCERRRVRPLGMQVAEPPVAESARSMHVRLEADKVRMVPVHQYTAQVLVNRDLVR